MFIDVPKVYLHVVDDIEHFTSIESLKKTVASIVGCTLDDIKVIGFQPENSFIIIITMRAEFLKILKKTNTQNLTKLLSLKVDWIRIEDKVIKIDAGESRIHIFFYIKTKPKTTSGIKIKKSQSAISVVIINILYLLLSTFLKINHNC